jgi:thioredoxin
MKALKGVLIFSFFFSVASCSIAGKPKENVTAPIAEKGEVLVLNKAEFLTKIFNYEKHPDKWIYEGDKPCIIDFYADWCAPCRQVSPVLKDLAVLYKNDIVVYKVNVDEERELAAVFGIRNIPALLFIPKEGAPQLSVGALPREDIVRQIDGFLLGKK